MKIPNSTFLYTYILYGLMLFMGSLQAATGTVQPVMAPLNWGSREAPVVSLIAHPDKVPQVLQEVSNLLHEAVDAANISAKNGEEEVKGDVEGKRVSELQQKYQKICFEKVGRALACLGALDKYYDPDAYNSGSGIDGLVALTASAPMSNYILDIAEHGFRQLQKDLQAWLERVRRDGSISEKNLNSVSESVVKEEPSLVGCALFWEDFVCHASPCFTNIKNLINKLNPMQGYCARFLNSYGTFLQEFVRMAGLQPEKAAVREPNTWFNGFMKFVGDYYGWTVDKSSKVVTSAFCKKYVRSLGDFLKHCEEVRLEILKLETYVPPTHLSESGKSHFPIPLFHEDQNQDAFQKAVNEFDTEIKELRDLQKSLESQEAADVFSTTIIRVHDQLGKAVKILRGIDTKLKSAMPGLLNLNKFTHAQVRSLKQLRSQPTLLADDSSMLRFMCVESIDLLQNILPKVDDAPELLQKLQNSFEIFQSTRGHASFNPAPPPDPRGRPTGMLEWILKGLGLASAADSIEWLAKEAFPPTIDHIYRTSKSIHEQAVVCEKMRAELAATLGTMRTCQRWLMPSVSLGTVCNRRFTVSILPGCSADRYRASVDIQEYCRKLEEEILCLKKGLEKEHDYLKLNPIGKHCCTREASDVFRKKMVSLIELVGNNGQLAHVESGVDGITGRRILDPFTTLLDLAEAYGLLKQYVIAKKKLNVLKWLSSKREMLLTTPEILGLDFLVVRQSCCSLSICRDYENDLSKRYCDYLGRASGKYGITQTRVGNFFGPAVAEKLVRDDFAHARDIYLRRKQEFNNMSWWKKGMLTFMAYLRLPLPHFLSLYQQNLESAFAQKAKLGMLHNALLGTKNTWRTKYNVSDVEASVVLSEGS